MSAFAASWWSWFAPISVQLIPIGIGIALLDRVWLRKQRAEWRAAVWALVFVKLVLPPDFRSPLALIGALPPSIREVYSGHELAAGGASSPSVWFGIWLAGFFAVLALRGFRDLALHRLARGDRAASEATLRMTGQLAASIGLRRLPRIETCDSKRGAFVVGILNPRIVLPIGLEQPARKAELRHVLAHELTHVRRHDPLRERVLFLLHAAFWFHPVVWLAHRELESLREQCCDLEAARVTGCANEYRRTLLSLAATQAGLRTTTGLGFASSSRVLSRLENLDRFCKRTIGPAQLHCMLLTGLLAFSCLPMTREPLPDPVLTKEAFDELPGCMQARFLVLRELAKQTNGAQD